MPDIQHRDESVEAVHRERKRDPERLAGSFEESYKIKFTPKHADDGYALLSNVGQVGALPDETYIVGSIHLLLLDDAGIPYEII